MMRLKDLEYSLSDVLPFDSPKVEFEQIPTSPHIASRMLFTAASRDDIVDCTVGDFGVGAGMLSIASNLLGSAYTIGFEVDSDALDDACVNFQQQDIDDIDLVQLDICSARISHSFDTIVMNPPFGTRNKGIDTAFVVKGMENASTVYSLHKTSTRDHFKRLADKNEYNIEVLAELKYDIPKTFKFHKEKTKDIYVDLYRFTHKS
jgi:predicted RNA methylase